MNTFVRAFHWPAETTVIARQETRAAMITDLRAMPTGVDLSADLCIVGSGPAGLTLASEFAQTKYTVIVLEAGGFDYEHATQELYTGQVIGRDYPVGSSRLRMFGGTSGHWNGQCGIPPMRHIHQRPWVADTSWPISFDELLPYYRKASRILELGNVDQDKDNVARLVRKAVLSANGPLAPFIWRTRLEGPLRFGTHMRKAMEDVANIHVLLHANVTGLQTNAEANQLQHIQFTTLDGNTGVARARYFVLACGGLEIPRLLLNTDDVQPAGLGNSRGLVGRYFMEHPNGIIGTLFLTNTKVAEMMNVLTAKVRNATPPIGFWMPAICLGETFEREQKINGGYYRLHGREPTWSDEWNRWRQHSSFWQRMHTMARLFDERLYAAYRRAYGYCSVTEFAHNQAAVFIEFEQQPNRDSRVLLTRDTDRFGLRRLALDWRLTEQDIRTARALGEAIGRQAYLSGWGRFQFAAWLLEEGIERSSEFGISFHHIGTTRMASDPQFGVVDPACRLFGCDNLYIAGSAVFPTASFVNPTMTIVALAYRMADALKARLT